ESGTGKEVVARAIHHYSRRAGKPFVAVSCAAIPATLLEAELFGHERGAFTDAHQRRLGKFELAHGGTIYLDEVGDLGPELQPKLLRVLQEREVERIGGTKTIALNVRVLATTNRDLRQCVRDGSFREDLYYRLNVFPLQVPPLRERREDIPALATRAIARHAEGSGKVPTLSDCALERLKAHEWPGNVRELENLIQRTMILLQGDTLAAGDFVFEEASSVAAPEELPEKRLQEDLKKREYRVIVDALQADGGNRSAVAARLGISPRTLRYKLARMREDGVRFPESPSPAFAAKP
ncbi:MAG: sigma-54 interaction domain-containing protein, partial [Woeseiaceae bacterium]